MPISLAALASRPRRTRVSITGATSATASSRATSSISACGTWPALSRATITASGSPWMPCMAWEKSASAAALIKWMA
jgi:hypothetical protein